MRYVPIENHPNLVRDMRTGTILSININEINAKNEARLKIKKSLEENDMLKKELDGIKEMLHKLIENGANG